MTTQLPPCSKWDVWCGHEVEGSASLGDRTLFVRRLPATLLANPDMLHQNGKFKRIWFCKEFTNWKFIRKAQPLFNEVCLEVYVRDLDNVPKDLQASCRIYIKTGLRLKLGDHISVGIPFHEETFMLGTGVKNLPTDYEKDIKILPYTE